ncbi:MAG TPA: hypothetical protein VNI55_01400, partial [Gaiellaceae bacterium]|nr:hypothetical protein [Gaiellaceae bacterium]
ARRELAESRQEPEAGIAAHMATMAQCDDLAAERDSLTAELAVKDEALRELIGACAVPLEALRMTEAYKPMLSPSMVETIIAATEVLRRHTAALASPEQEPTP